MQSWPTFKFSSLWSSVAPSQASGPEGANEKYLPHTQVTVPPQAVAPVPEAFGRLVPVTQAWPEALRPDAYQDALQFDAHIKFGRLHRAAGPPILFGPVLGRGATGVVRAAFDENNLGRPMVLKMYNMPMVDPAAKDDTAHLDAVDAAVREARGAIIQEASTTQYVRRAIDQRVAQLARQFPYDALLLLRNAQTASLPTEGTYHVLDDSAEGRMHVLMDAESGDADSLRYDLRRREVGFVALSLATQCFTELSVLHDHLHSVHSDLKLSNLFVSHTGKIRLGDFDQLSTMEAHGACRPHDAWQDLLGKGAEMRVPPSRVQEAQRGLFGWSGTLMAPELGDLTLQPLTAALDTFTMGLTVFEAAVSPGVKNPFLLPQNIGFLEPEQARRKIRRRMEDFDRYLGAFRQPGGQIKSKKVIPYTHALFDPFILPLLHVDPWLGKLMMKHALAYQPSKRANCEAIAITLCVRLKSMQATQAWVGLKSIRSMIRRVDRMDEYRAYAADYLNWERVQLALANENEPESDGSRTSSSSIDSERTLVAA